MSREVRVFRLPHGAGLPLPEPASAGAAGRDLHAAVDRELVLAAGERALVPTGLVLALPDGLEGQIRPRSGLALHHGITVLNAPGTIDADYRGEVGVVLVNHGREPFTVRRGMRIAQLVFAPVAAVALREAEGAPPPTDRADAGFGSTGAHPGAGREDNPLEGPSDGSGSPHPQEA
jgi:dUTP pyrophosphatase